MGAYNLKEERAVKDILSVKFSLDEFGVLRTSVESDRFNASDDEILSMVKSLQRICGEGIAYDIISEIAINGYRSSEEATFYKRLLLKWNDYKTEKDCEPCVKPSNTLRYGKYNKNKL